MTFFANRPALGRLMRQRQVALARGRSLDQISQPRKGLPAAVNRPFRARDQSAGLAGAGDSACRATKVIRHGL